MTCWKLTLACTREEAERLNGDLPELAAFDPTPVLVASEKDGTDGWRLDAYFDDKPSRILLRAIARLVPSAREREPRAQPLAADDWVTLSQAGLTPVRAGRFVVRTPDHPPTRDSIDLVIPAGLAFGTGQHDTTRGCLEALDALKQRGTVFRNLLDLGTGTGVLAFAAMHLWPVARATASDIDAVSIAVVRENAHANAVKTGIGPGRLMLAAADGLASPTLIRRAPYDLVVANILAQPLIVLAPSVAAALTAGGTLILAGLLADQSDGVAAAYRRVGLRLVSMINGPWPVLVMRKR